MASEQMSRRENTNRVIQREIHIEKNRKEHEGDEKKEKERELFADRARSANIVKDKELEMRDEEKSSREREELERRTRVVEGKVWSGGEKKETIENKRDSKGENEDQTKEDNEDYSLEEISKYRAQAQQNSIDAIARAQERYARAKQTSNEAPSRETQNSEEKIKKAKGREQEAREGKVLSSLEDISKNRAQAQQNSMEAIARAQERYEREKIAANEAKRREQEAREEDENSSLEEISKYRAQAQQNSMDAIARAQERYETAKKQASNEEKGDFGGGNEGQTREESEKSSLEEISNYRSQAQQNSMEAISNAQQRYERAKQASNEALTSATQKAQEKASQARDITFEKATQAKDVTTKVASDLKDKASVAGWSAANYSAEKTVEGTKAVADVVEGAAGYAGQKASEIAAKSVDVAKGFASAAGDTAMEYTARKKEDAHRDLEAKKAVQNQESEERSPTETINENLQRGEAKEQFEDEKGKEESGLLDGIGETIAELAQTTKLLLVGESETESRKNECDLIKKQELKHD